MIEHEHIRDIEKQIEEDPSLEEDHEVQEQLAFLQQQLKEEETELLALQEQDWQTLYSLDIEKDKERIEELEDPYYPFRNMVKWPTDFSERVTYHQMVWLKEHDIKPILPYNIFGTMTIYDRQHDSPEIEESISRYSNKFSTNAFYFLYKFLSYFFSMLGIGFFLFLFADIVTKEGIGAYGPANFLFTQPLTRGKIYISKFLTLIVSTVVVFLSLSFFSLLLGVVFDDLGSWNYPILIYQPEEGIYELIDGLQRLSSYFHFRGALKDKPGEFLCLTGCDIVDELNGYTYEDLPKSLQIKLKRNFIRVEIIRRGSDERLRYHMFKRLNTGGEVLSEQEIRNSVIRLLDNTFNEFIIDLSEHSDFKACIMNISDGDRDRKGDQEYVLKFFAYKNDRESYRKDIAPFLSKYMEKVSFGQIGDEEKGIDFSFEEEREIFEKTFSVLSKVGGEYVFSRLRDGNYTKTLVPNFYDAITIGIQRSEE